jgi:hypothetical protein
LRAVWRRAEDWSDVGKVAGVVGDDEENMMSVKRGYGRTGLDKEKEWMGGFII